MNRSKRRPALKSVEQGAERNACYLVRISSYDVTPVLLSHTRKGGKGGGWSNKCEDNPSDGQKEVPGIVHEISVIKKDARCCTSNGDRR